MATTYPGTAIEATSLQKGGSRSLFDGIFAAGGVSLSQVSNMTGLEPHVIQNWVKRKFVASPVRKLYSKEQFARIIIINMLRESLQIDAICNLIQIISGVPDDPTDDLISDDELYHMYVDMISESIDITDKSSVLSAAEAAVTDFRGQYPSAKKQLTRILQAMLYAHTAARLRDEAKEMLSSMQ